MASRRESDLYHPIKEFLQQQGYTVRGEVNDCDLVAVRGDDLVIVELKIAFNLALVFQGIDRQSMTDAVYVAIEAPRQSRSAPRWTEIRALCRRLGLGLMTVHFRGQNPYVEVVCDPEPYTPRKQPKLRGRLLREFQRRTGDHNAGGTSRRPIVTAYREEALRIAAFLQRHGPGKTRVVRTETGIDRCATILRQDYYGWFQRVSTGVYQITARAEQALLQYQDVLIGQAAAAKQND